MMTASSVHKLIVGTFNTPELFLIAFDPDKASLFLETRFDVIGNHSWLALDESKSRLYATCWTEPPSIAAYKIDTTIELVRTCNVKSRSGYVVSSTDCAYSAGGPSGEVIGLESFEVLQKIDYVTGRAHLTEKGKLVASTNAISKESVDDQGSYVRGINGSNGAGDAVMDFGGLRHGAHSADLSPDGSILYVADIGRNCVWVHNVVAGGLLEHGQKIASPRSNDGPRHVWPHPNGKVVYVLQEHSCMVDVFRVCSGHASPSLEWQQGVRIIPEAQDESKYWADEVRIVAGSDLLVASTRGLESDTKGYVALFGLRSSGLISMPDDASEHRHAWLDMWQTPTSGGWANAVEPCKFPLHASRDSQKSVGDRNDGQYVALTDSEQGLVIMLAVEYGQSGRPKLTEIARLALGKTSSGKIRGAATAVWL